MQNFAHLKKMQKNLHPWKNVKKFFEPLKKCKKFYTPENMQKPTQLPKLQQTPYKTLQKSKAEKFPSYPLTNPKKPLNFPWISLEIPLQNQHFSKTRHQQSSSNRQQKQRTEKVGKKSPLDQLLHPLEFFSRFFGKR